MLKVMYDFYFIHTKLRLRVFAAALGVVILCGMGETALLGRSEYQAARDVSLIALAFLVLYQFALFRSQNLPTLPGFLQAMQKAKQLYAESRDSEAFQIYSNLLTYAPIFASRADQLELLVRVAMTCRDTGNIASMVSYLEEAREIAHDGDDRAYQLTLYLAAEGYFSLGRHKQAISRFEEFVSLHQGFDRKKLEAFLFLLASYLRLGNFQQAHIYQLKALRLMERRPDLKPEYFNEAMLVFQ